MEQDDDNLISRKTENFIFWYRKQGLQKKEFVSALMIANLSDEKLERIKLLTEQCADELITVFAETVS